MATGDVRIKQDQVVSQTRGWITYKDSKGVEKKARASKVKILNADGLRRIGSKKYNCKHYARVKSASGAASMDCGDTVATMFRNMDLEAVYAKVAKQLKVPVSELTSKYSHLNPGMQRMTLGNRLRAVLREETGDEE